MKNDNRIFNNLQRATTPELIALQDLASRLTSDSTSIGTSHRIDGLNITSPGAGLIQVSSGSAAVTNPSPSGLEPEKLILALRANTTVSVPTTGVWYRVSCAPGAQTVTTATIDIYNPGTQTFAPAIANVQATNSLAITLTAGTATTYPSTPAGHLTLGFVFDRGASVLVGDLRRWNTSGTLVPGSEYRTDDAGYLENSIRISPAGSVTWRTVAECYLGTVSCALTNVSPTLLASAGLTLTGNTMYHFYVMCPGNAASRDPSTQTWGVPVISNIAPPTYQRLQTGIVSNSGFYGAQWPTGAGVYCGSMYYLGGTTWLPWVINGNNIEMNTFASAFSYTQTGSGTTFSMPFSAGNFTGLNAIFRSYKWEAYCQMNANSATGFMLTFITDTPGNVYATENVEYLTIGVGAVQTRIFAQSNDTPLIVQTDLYGGTGTMQNYVFMRGASF